MNYSYRCFKKRNPTVFTKISFCRKLVKAAIKSDRIGWLKSIDESLNSEPEHFWKCVASFKKRNATSIQLEVDGKHSVEPCDVADELSSNCIQCITILVLMSSPPFLHLLIFDF
jgi:hypothetical protein